MWNNEFSWGWRDRIADRLPALHVADPQLIPSIAHDPLKLYPLLGVVPLKVDLDFL